VYEAEAGRSEWVTAVECVCADGTVIPPMIIFKGENFSKAWVPSGMDKDWNWACTSKGWTCDDLAFQWIKRVFHPATHEKANGRRRTLLVCDSVVGKCIDVLDAMGWEIVYY